MLLRKVRIQNFQSVMDSNEFDVGDVTCLVGKNEAGKTALLKALYRLNPIIETEGGFDATDDYPAVQCLIMRNRSRLAGVNKLRLFTLHTNLNRRMFPPSRACMAPPVLMTMHL